MMSKRSAAAYGFLAVVAVMVCLWQGMEHARVQRAAETALLNRALDISNTLGVVLRSQAFFSMVWQPRLEEALRELTKTGELKGVALLYASGEPAAAAGTTPNVRQGTEVRTGAMWSGDRFVVVNPVDLGTDEDEGEEPQTSIVIPQGEGDRFRRPPGSRRFFRGGRPGESREQGESREPDEQREPGESREPDRPEPPDREGSRPEGARGPRMRPESPEPPTFARPPWLSEQEYRDLVNKQGVHYFVLSLSTEAYQARMRQDVWIRLVTVLVALVAVGGLGLAWRNAERSASLQMNLLRADEMNRHLHEMNLAAAGLAHETRNPLNIIRGLAQLISSRDDAPGDVRETSWRITDEVDRVTDRVNQFLAYSRPPEAKPAPTELKRVVNDVARTLETDCEDKRISFELTGPDVQVEADESLLRQIVFNLLLNAIQALPEGGHVAVVVSENGDGTARMEVRDNGPGVPEAVREQIFRPYFTTSEHGTGLGLAVVQHAVHAHHWDIAYVPGEGGGAVFRVGKMKVV